MNIPSRVNPFGYDNTTPPGYVRAEFLSGTGGQYIDTGIVKTGAFNVSITFSNPTRRCTGWGYSYTVDSVRYQSHDELQGSGRYIRFCYENVSIYPFPPYDGYTPLEKHTMVFNTGKRPLTIDGESVAVGLASLSRYDISNPLGKSNYLFAVNGLRNEPYLNIYAFSTWDDGKGKDIDLIPVLDPSGEPCMYDTITGQPFRNSGTGSDFIVGLTTKQAISLANLPATGGSLTISIPLEAAFDANVESALETAAAKGWTITIQYHKSDVATTNLAADFLESTGVQGLTFTIPFSLEDQTTVEYMLTGSSPESGTLYQRAFGGTRNNGHVSNDASGADELHYAWNSTCYLTASSTTQSIWAAATSLLRSVIQLRAKNTAILTNGKITLNGYSRSGTKEEGDVSFTSGYQLFGWGGGTSFSTPMRLYSFKHERNGRMLVQLVPALDSAGVPCMYDTVSGQNLYNANTAEGATSFIVGFETTEKAAISLSKLPLTTGGTLTVSLPATAQDTDTLVPAAIDIATNRGWTIITQYRED